MVWQKELSYTYPCIIPIILILSLLLFPFIRHSAGGLRVLHAPQCRYLQPTVPYLLFVIEFVPDCFCSNRRQKFWDSSTHHSVPIYFIFHVKPSDTFFEDSSIIGTIFVFFIFYRRDVSY